MKHGMSIAVLAGLILDDWLYHLFARDAALDRRVWHVSGA